MLFRSGGYNDSTMDAAIRANGWAAIDAHVQLPPLMLSADTEDNYKAYTHFYITRDRHKPLVDAIKERVNWEIKYAHKDEVFDEIEVRDGRIVRDGNAHFFDM